MASTLIKAANNTKVTVANTSTAVLAANNARLGAVFVNKGDEDITIAFGEDAVANEGIPLAAGGGYVMDSTQLTTLAVNAICASGGKTLSVVEFT